MPQILRFPSQQERLCAALSLNEREFVERLLRIVPDYKYELSGLPKLNPMPVAGLESAIAAAKAILAFHAAWGGVA